MQMGLGLAGFIAIALALTFFPRNWKHSINRPTVDIGVVRSIAERLIFIADHQHLFTDQGLDVHLHWYSSSDDSLQALELNRLDLSVGFEAPVVDHFLAGSPILVLTQLNRSTKDTILLAWRESGIHKPGDLRGKRIGITPGLGNAAFVRIFLQEKGILPQNVHLVELTKDRLIPEFLSHRIDAVAVWQDDLTRAVQNLKPSNFIVFHSRLFMEASMLLALPNFIRLHPDIIQRVLLAIIQAQRFMEAHPAKSKKIVAEYLKGSLTSDQMQEMWESAQSDLGLSNILLSILNHEIELDELDEPPHAINPNVHQLIFAEPLRKVRPDLVTIY